MWHASPTRTPLQSTPPHGKWTPQQQWPEEYTPPQCKNCSGMLREICPRVTGEWQTGFHSCGNALTCLRQAHFTVGPLWIRHEPAHSMGARSDLDLGYLEAFSSVTFLSPFLSGFCVVVGCIVLLGPLPSRDTWTTMGYTWSATMFGWVVHVKWHPHERQDSNFSLDCIELVKCNLLYL